MAKQTFTTGQVLTAAQMTSLQQTAMLGGSASAKTASYTLVAADAGTAISMSNASATTITVNTALFAAGDTVQITNIGVGVCTITAGTATVNTASSLALAQYESGTLYFTSTSAAIFIKAAGAPPSSSGGMTLINTGGTTLTGASVTVSSIPATYTDLYIIVANFKPATDNRSLQFYMNGDNTATKYKIMGSQTYLTNQVFDDGSVTIVNEQDSGTDNGMGTVLVNGYTLSTWKKFAVESITNNATTPTNVNLRFLWSASNITAAISSLTFFSDSGNMTSGTVYVYGVK
jgi:hypothetical protein